MFKSLSAMQIALGISVGVHAVLLSVRFIDPEGFNRMFEDTPLEVILVNASSSEAPVKAQAIAQRNLAGGGEAESGRATSPLPSSAQVQLGDSAIDTYRQIDQLVETQQQLLAQLPPPDPKRDRGDPQNRSQEDQRRQLLQLMAEIEKRINEENSRPKRRYISPATREELYALYYDKLRRKIEDRGTRSFPEYQGKKLYGELTMNITVNAEGRVVSVDVVRPSGVATLDKRAIAIVHAAAPFGSFTDPMRKKADELVITSRFRFTRNDGLETTLSAPAS
jgi:protein TonB